MLVTDRTQFVPCKWPISVWYPILSVPLLNKIIIFKINLTYNLFICLQQQFSRNH